MTGEQVEKELAMAHRVLAQAAFQINLMLTTRRLNLRRISEATEKASDAASYMQRLDKLLKVMHKAK